MQNGVMDIHYCPSEQMIVDVLPKPLARVKMEQMRLRLGLEPAEIEEECCDHSNRASLNGV